MFIAKLGGEIMRVWFWRSSESEKAKMPDNPFFRLAYCVISFSSWGVILVQVKSIIISIVSHRWSHVKKAGNFPSWITSKKWRKAVKGYFICPLALTTAQLNQRTGTEGVLHDYSKIRVQCDNVKTNCENAGRYIIYKWKANIQIMQVHH